MVYPICQDKDTLRWAVIWWLSRPRNVFWSAVLLTYLERSENISPAHIMIHVADLLKGEITRLFVKLNSLHTFRILHEGMFRTKADDRELAAHGQAHNVDLHGFFGYFHSIN